jgi:hypothetical protein
MNTKTNLLQMAIADGCKTIKDLALYIKKNKSQNSSNSVKSYYQNSSINNRVIVRF